MVLLGWVTLLWYRDPDHTREGPLVSYLPLTKVGQLPPDRLYLAGKMRGVPLYNFPAFHAAAIDLRERGYEVLNPAEHDEDSGFDPASTPYEEFDLEAAFRWDIRAVLEVDAVVVLPGWEDSGGANLEVAVANKIGTPVLAYPELDPVTPEPVTVEAARLVTGPRQSAYGPPHLDFERTGRMWGAILGIPDIPPAKVGLCMVAMKISREVNKHKRDNLVDMAGYAETVWLARQHEQRIDTKIG